MDVKQLDFLARQASARLEMRDRVWGLPKRGIAFILVNALFWQPFWALADGIVVSGGSTSMGVAGNGVQVVNIAKPNDSGLSHNTFSHYNVGKEGVILNNATGQTQSTQLGGIIIGNSNLQGQAATTILNEVTGNNRTQLKGYTEVAGHSARVIVANPYGITCNGCGFINTPQATLTTGKPVLSNGRVTQFRVEGGDISIEGSGLNASNLDQFDLITRSATLNAKLYAKKLNVVTGRNQVDADTLHATALAKNGSPEPALAIDSSALGGMYAGSIRLVGTEQGVGVRLSGEMAASAGEIVIDANGKVTMATTAARGAVTVKASSVEATNAVYAGTHVDIQAKEDLLNQKSIAAGGNITLASTGSLTNLGVIEAGVNTDNSRNPDGDVEIAAKDLRNAGQVVATRELTATVGQLLDNRDGKLIGKQVNVSGKQVDNSKGLIAASEGSASLTASERLNNTDGTVQAETHLTVIGGSLTNHNGAVLGKQVTVNGDSLDNSHQGRIVADSGALDVTIDGALDNQEGRLQGTKGDVTVKAGSLDNRKGVVVGEQVKASSILNTLDNRGGQLLGTRLEVAGVDIIDNRDGGQLIAGSGGLKITTGLLQNQQGTVVAGGSHAEIDLGQGRLENQAGTINAGSLTLTADEADNSDGSLSSLGGNLNLTVGRLTNRTGLIEASHSLLLSGRYLDNTAGGRLLAHRGELSQINLSDSLDNSGGRIAIGSQAFSLETGTLYNQSGQIEHATTGQFTLNANRVEGDQGRLVGLGNGQWTITEVEGGGFWHQNGALDISGLQAIALRAGDRISSAGSLSLQATSLINAGELLSDGDLTVILSESLSNQGLISTQKALTLKAQDLTQEGGRIASADNAGLELRGILDNHGRLTSSKDMTVTADRIDNRGTLGAQQALKLTATHDINNQADSLVFAGTDMTLRADSLLNRYADIYSEGNLSFEAIDGGKASRLSNLSGGIESGGDIEVKVAELENAKAEFKATQSATSRAIDINCTDCSGDHHTGFYIVNTTYRGQILKDSPASRFLANRDLKIDADTVTNSQSLLAANRDAIINANNFYNRGFTLDNRIESISYHLWGVTQDAYRVTEAATLAWNNSYSHLPVNQQAEIPTAVTMYPVSSSSNTLLPGNGATYVGTVQAGGALNLNITNELVNGSLNDQGMAQLTGKTLDSRADGAGTQQVVLNTPVGAPGPLKDVKRVETTRPDGSVQVSFIPVDFSGAPFVSVDPTALTSFRLPEGDYGLFTRSRNPAGQYLIESNPTLTNLSQFMSSDYLLGLLNYDFTEASRRLGDGRYETRLISEAVRAQTGQRFLAEGLSDDYEQFRYLMDNAVASKQALGLTVGVGLTSEQVAALTHDIVWMEERVIEGETVLTPVLYLAKVDSRNLRGGSLVQGRDVQLFTGADLKNVGTLRASYDLAMISNGNIYQGGLAQANDTLSMMATESIRNAMAGEIRGDKVSLVSLGGGILNDRTSESVTIGAGRQTRVDVGGNISAGSQLTMFAGADLVNFGQISSNGDASLTAGRDINLLAIEDRTLTQEALRRGLRVEEKTTQLGSSLTVTGNLTLKAESDITMIASKAVAGGDIKVEAKNVDLLAAIDEDNQDSTYKKGHKKVHEVDNQSRQVASELSAGGSIDIRAKHDIELIASKITAGKSAYIYAGNDINVLAAQNVDYKLYDMKKKGDFGSKESKRDEVTDVKNIGSQISSGENLTIASGKNQLYQGAKLESGKDLTLESGGSITFEAVKDLRQESHEESSSSLAWVSMSGEGNTDEQIRQSVLLAQGQIAIKAASGLNIDIKQIDQQTVSQAINAMVAADPQLAWLKDAEKRGDVNWRMVQEVHDSFEYSHSGLGPGAMVAIAIVITVLTAGSGAAAALGTSATSTATNAALAAGLSETTAAAIGAAAGAAATATMSAVMSQTVISTINNKGNIGAALKDVTSPDSLKGYLISGLVAGFTAGVLDEAFGVTSEGAGKATHGFNLGELDGFTKYAGYTLTENAFAATANAAINGVSLKDALAQAAIGSVADSLSASIYNKLGTQLEFSGLPAKVAAHALVGGLITELAGGNFKTGALAAGANEAFVATVGDAIFKGDAHDQLLALTSQLIGMSVAAIAGGSDKDQAISGWVASQATKFNSLDHPTAEKLLSDIKECRASRACSPEKLREILTRAENMSADRSALYDACETMQCVEDLRAKTIALDDPVAKDLLDLFKRSISYDMTGLLTGDPSNIAMPSQGMDEWGAVFVTDDQLIQAKYIKEGWLTPAQMAQLDVWSSQTDWIDRAVGRKLTPQEKASTLLELTSIAAIGAFGGRGTSGAKTTGSSLDNVARNIHAGQQGKHVLGHNNFIPGRSYFNEGVDPQKLLNGVHKGEFSVVGYGSRGQPIVDFGKNIGIDGSSGLATRYGTLHSGKNGAHIVPTNPNTIGAKP